MPRLALMLLLLPLWLAGCTPSPRVEDLPPGTETLERVRQRMGTELSIRKLQELVADGDRVLAGLTREERDALGRCWIRFRVDRPAVVTILAPARSVPFWLADQGFRQRPERLNLEDEAFLPFQKSCPAGWIGLGVNSLDQKSPAHYAILLCGPNGEPLTPTDLRGAVDAPSSASPFLDLPADLKTAIVLPTRHDERHAAALATGRVWKTRQPSTTKPDQIVVSYGEQSGESLSFTWRTSRDRDASVLRIAPDASKETLRIIKGDSHEMDSAGLLNDRVIRRHRAVASGLSPDTPYRYSVGDGSPENWSDWHSIKTAKVDARDMRFLYLGDAQCGLEGWGKLLHRAYQHAPDAEFLLLAGDLVDRGNERSNWDFFFDRAKGVFETVPFLPAVGNHEYLDRGPHIYRNTFDLPRNGPAGIDPNLVYSFESGDAFFAVMDTTLAVHSRPLARLQAQWLDGVLAKTRKTWKFVMFHHPVYASHVSRENPILQQEWVPTFDKHHVDVVLQGHDHAYLRTFPMRANRRVESPREGTVYVVSVSGEKFYEQGPRPYIAQGYVNLATYQILDLNADSNRLSYRAYDAEGREVDRFEIQKEPAEVKNRVAKR